MTENTTTDEYVYKYKNEQSIDDNNNSAIILNQYQSFLLDDYSFIIGTTDNESIYMECKQNEKYYKTIISKKNCYVINEKFQTCKSINEIYKLILTSVTKNQINISYIKNNKIRFTISITADDTKPSYFEIILKEEKNKNDAIIYKLEKKNEAALLKENNEHNSDLQRENSDSIFMEAFKKDILANYKQNRSVGYKPNDAKQEKNDEKKDNNNNENILDMAEEEEEEEDEDNDDDDDDIKENNNNNDNNNINKENETNNVLDIINNLKNELLYLKNVINKNGQNNNEEKIKELEIKNNNLVE